jgi:ribonuclease HII
VYINMELSTQYEVGVDEVGRGCLFGPVVACAVVMPLVLDDAFYKQIKDSKKLSEKKRGILEDYIKKTALSYGFGICDHKVIDSINILQASIRAMHHAITEVYRDCIEKEKPLFEKILVDGTHFKPYIPPGEDQDVMDYECIEQGDNKKLNIAAASILAKCYRDRWILEQCELNTLLDRYDLKKNKGYGTAKHIKGLREYGPIEGHRLTFGKVL